MEEYLGVVVEPWELDGERHDRVHDGLYGFDEKCIVTRDAGRYAAGAFDLVEVEDFPSYWEESGKTRMFVAGDPEATVDLFSEVEVSSEEVSFEMYTVSGFVDYPGTGEVLKDEIRSMLPFQERRNLVEENTVFEMLEEMGVPEADVIRLGDVAQPPDRSRYYSNTSV
jgi:hypothetical protein